MRKILVLISFFLLLFIPAKAFAETNIPQRPDNGIYDPQHYLSQEVEKKIAEHNKNATTQIGIYIVDTLDGHPIEDQANKIAREWKIGNDGENKGILVAIAIKDRKFRIETSNEVSVYLTDGESKTILNSTKDYMRKNDYSGGVIHIINQIEKELTTDPESQAKQQSNIPNGEKLILEIIGWLGPLLLIPLLLLYALGESLFSLLFGIKKKNDKLENGTMDTKRYKKDRSGGSNTSSGPVIVPYYPNTNSSSSSSKSSSSYSSSDSSSWSSDSWSGGGFDGGGSSGSW